MLARFAHDASRFRFQTSGQWWKRKHLPRCIMRGASDGPMEIQTKEAKLHEGSASSLCLHCASFRGFRMTRPKRGGGYGCSPPHHAGNLLLCPCEAKRRESYQITPADASNVTTKMKLVDWRIGGVEEYGADEFLRSLWAQRILSPIMRICVGLILVAR